MRILYDYQTFYLQKYGGISNCFVQLLKNLPAGFEYELALSESDNIHLKESGLKKVMPLGLVEENFISTKWYMFRGALYREYSKCFPSRTSLGRNRQCSIDALKRGNFDVFHPTFFDDYFLPYLNHKPFVLTVHDMIPELFGKMKWHDPQIKAKSLLCKKAAHVIAVSEKTKNDLMDMLHVPEQKISVIYHGATDKKNASTEKPLVYEKYILYVGNRGRYKCFGLMLQYLTPVLKMHPELKIVCTGKNLTGKEMLNIQKLGIGDRIILMHPSDHELMNLYTHAFCFIFPSIYEGFGIPILEAYKAGCPVLLNYKSCFPEVAQDAAIYFHLDENGSDLGSVMEQFIFMGDDDKQCLLRKQNERLAFFSWEKSAKKLADVYEKCI